MKRYRVLSFDFDSRATTLQMEIQPEWEDAVQESWRTNQQAIRDGLVREFGEYAADAKIANFTELGPKPLSILAFHNRFAAEIRAAFVVGGYYPALTGACALGERILNHLILILRADFRHSPGYKRVYRKDSFDNWEMPITVLEKWEVLLPDAAAIFRKLAAVRNRAIHFHPETDHDARKPALEAIGLLDQLIVAQFPMMGLQPWFIADTPGESYIKHDWECKPFVRRIYLPNCLLVGPGHEVIQVVPTIVVRDREDYRDVEISDAEFVRLRYHRVLSEAADAERIVAPDTR